MARLRRIQRATHLTAATAVGVFVYAAGARHGLYAALVIGVFFPTLAVTGFAMWLGPRVARQFEQRRSSAADARLRLADGKAVTSPRQEEGMSEFRLPFTQAVGAWGLQRRHCIASR
jgi:hypothetical protein